MGFLGGFEHLGRLYPALPFEILWANDVNGFACAVYQANIGEHVHEGDISRIRFDSLAIDATGIDVLIGGFPCQEFALRGPRGGLLAARGQLYQQMRRAIGFFRPKIFIAENVPGIECPPTTLRTIMRALGGSQEPRYRVSRVKVNAADYGVPQIRNRLIIIGVRSDIAGSLRIPSPVHRNPLQQTNGLPSWLTASEALEDLWDPTDPDESKIADQNKLTRATIVLGTPKRRDRRLLAASPSPTIRAEHHGHVEVHYNTQLDGTLRRLTVRECARLQGFPDSFVFPVSATQAYRQIGNAIPPVMAYYWAEAIHEWLEGHRAN